ASGAGDTITAAAGNANISIVGAIDDSINLTGNTGGETIVGAVNETVVGGSGHNVFFAASGDSITTGTGNNYVDMTAGKMTVVVGPSGTDTLVGSLGQSGANTVSALAGSTAAVTIASLGKGDRVDLFNTNG